MRDVQYAITSLKSVLSLLDKGNVRAARAYLDDAREYVTLALAALDTDPPEAA